MQDGNVQMDCIMTFGTLLTKTRSSDRTQTIDVRAYSKPIDHTNIIVESPVELAVGLRFSNTQTCFASHTYCDLHLSNRQY